MNSDTHLIDINKRAWILIHLSQTRYALQPYESKAVNPGCCHRNQKLTFEGKWKATEIKSWHSANSTANNPRDNMLYSHMNSLTGKWTTSRVSLKTECQIFMMESSTTGLYQAYFRMTISHQSKKRKRNWKTFDPFSKITTIFSNPIPLQLGQIHFTKK